MNKIFKKEKRKGVWTERKGRWKWRGMENKDMDTEGQRVCREAGQDPPRHRQPELSPVPG